MNPPFDPPRQIATQYGNPVSQPDISKYTYSVADTVIAFRKASMSITERTIQRYCHRGKLRAVLVDPDTRQLTDKDNYIFLIDPTSIPERVAQLREKQEFVSPTVVASSQCLALTLSESNWMPRSKYQWMDVAAVRIISSLKGAGCR